MSIETNIARIADALELIAEKLNSAQVETKAPQTEPKAPAPEVKTVKAETKGTTPPAPPAPEAPVPAPPAPEAPSLTVKDAQHCNELLVAEYNRLGATPEVMQKILATMNSLYSVRSVNELTVDQYAPLIEAVREMK